MLVLLHVSDYFTLQITVLSDLIKKVLRIMFKLTPWSRILPEKL